MRTLLSIVRIDLMAGLAVLTAGRNARAEERPLPAALGAIHPRISPDGRRIVVSYQGAFWTVPSQGGPGVRPGTGDSHQARRQHVESQLEAARTVYARIAREAN